MKKVGIIRCQQTEDYCPATKCLLMAKEGQGSFEESGIGACEVVGVVSCGGCPGKRAVFRAQELVKRGAEVIMMGSCIKIGTPMAFPCPNKAIMLKSIRKKIGDEIPILEYSHL